MNADEMTKTWAARRTGIPKDRIERVEFIHEDGYAYSEYTEELASDGANVWVADSIARYISLDNMDFGEILAEIIEAQDA